MFEDLGEECLEDGFDLFGGFLVGQVVLAVGVGDVSRDVGDEKVVEHFLEGEYALAVIREVETEPAGVVFGHTKHQVLVFEHGFGQLGGAALSEVFVEFVTGQLDGVIGVILSFFGVDAGGGDFKGDFLVRVVDEVMGGGFFPKMAENGFC